MSKFNYLVSVRGDRYAMNYQVVAGGGGAGWATAMSRGVRLWTKDKGKHARTDKIVATCERLGPVLVKEGKKA